jgi:hypothetical protein
MAVTQPAIQARILDVLSSWVSMTGPSETPARCVASSCSLTQFASFYAAAPSTVWLSFVTGPSESVVSFNMR